MILLVGQDYGTELLANCHLRLTFGANTKKKDSEKKRFLYRRIFHFCQLKLVKKLSEHFQNLNMKVHFLYGMYTLNVYTVHKCTVSYIFYILGSRLQTLSLNCHCSRKVYH